MKVILKRRLPVDAGASILCRFLIAALSERAIISLVSQSSFRVRPEQSSMLLPDHEKRIHRNNYDGERRIEQWPTLVYQY